MNIAYCQISNDLQAPGDYRRFVGYCNSNKVKFTVLRNSDLKSIKDGDFDFAVQSENDKLTVKLKNNSHLPSNFINASWQGFYVTATTRI